MGWYILIFNGESQSSKIKYQLNLLRWFIIMQKGKYTGTVQEDHKYKIIIKKTMIQAQTKGKC